MNLFGPWKILWIQINSLHNNKNEQYNIMWNYPESNIIYFAKSPHLAFCKKILNISFDMHELISACE